MKTAYLILEILAIVSQMFHNYWIVFYSSGLNNKVAYKFRGKDKTYSPKQIQAWVFCGIVDSSIILALIEEHWWAYVGVLVLLTINCIYVYNTYEDYKSNKNLEHKVTNRRKVTAYFMAVLIPACIYIFAELYIGK